MSTLYADIETYCDVPINHGTHVYAARAEVILVQWAIDDGPVVTAEHLEDLPDAMRFERVVFHNSYFDRTVLHVQGIELPLDRLHDTYVMALMHSLPGGLDKLSQLFKLPVDEAKDKEGKKLINLFCKPRPKRQKLRRATKETHPEEWERFKLYGERDIVAMRAIYKKLPRWNMMPDEMEAWLLDQKINDRGVQIDMELVRAAIDMRADEQALLADQAAELTDGEVVSATQRDVLLAYINETYGVWLPDLKTATVERFIKDNAELSETLVDLLGVRLQAAMASVAKYNTLARSTSADGRLRGALQFCGAARTGRWAGRRFQPQNLPRPNLKNAEIEAGIEAIKAGCADLVTNNRMGLASNALRGTIIAGPRRKLCVADLSNIEGRALAWEAGEEWKLKAFSDFDQGIGLDLYVLAYCRAHGMAPQEITKFQRQLGKVMELALGYEGGVGAFVTFVMTYKIDLALLTDDAVNPELRREAADAWGWTKANKRPTFGLPREIWVICDALKRAWRTGHPATVDLWADARNAFRDALESPGRDYRAGVLTFRRDGAWIRMVLPSGRSICYPQPKVDEKGISYMGVHQWTKQWARIRTYGGKIIENATQAIARDVLRDGAKRADAAGYEIVLSVHDELITETPISSRFTHQGLAQLMSTNSYWNHGLPLAAAGFEAQRYHKED